MAAIDQCARCIATELSLAQARRIDKGTLAMPSTLGAVTMVDGTALCIYHARALTADEDAEPRTRG